MSGARALVLLLLAVVGSILSTGLSPLTRWPPSWHPGSPHGTVCGANQSTQRWWAGGTKGCLGAGHAGAGVGDRLFDRSHRGSLPHGLRALGLGLLLLLLHRVAGQLLVVVVSPRARWRPWQCLVFRLMLTLIVLVADGDRDLAWSGLRGLPIQMALTAGGPVVISVLSRIDARLWSKVAKPGLWA